MAARWARSRWGGPTVYDLFFQHPAAWFTIPAILGTAFFIIRLSLMLAGADGGDADMDMDLDVDHSDSTESFKILSIQGVTAFAMGFGWGGLGGLRGAGWDLTGSLAIGVVAGVGMVWLILMLMRGIHSLQQSGNVPLAHMDGATGEVYVGIPGEGKGTGQVRIVVNNRQRIVNAVTEGVELPTKSRVRVTRVNEDNTVTVVPG